jgi:hypothetical protein
MSNDLRPWTLTWTDVDPSEQPFFPEEAAGVVARLARSTDFPLRPDGPAHDKEIMRWGYEQGRAWADALTRALVEYYGQWAAGWRWAHDEGDVGGGPVAAWCCPRDSMTTLEETSAKVAAALAEWRGWIEDLAERFERFPLAQLPPQDRSSAWERGASHLVTAVVERTGAGDAWYVHCQQVLSWFLERWQVPAERAEALVAEAIGGRFESWVGPSPELLAEVAGQLAGSASSL